MNSIYSKLKNITQYVHQTSSLSREDNISKINWLFVEMLYVEGRFWLITRPHALMIWHICEAHMTAIMCDKKINKQL